MILTDAEGRAPLSGIAGRATLDDLFRRATARRPHALALVDPPNRESFTTGAPRRLTYVEADRAVSAMAARLRHVGLKTDAIVALQFANTVESVLTLLAVLRAGLIAMPLPVLWRRADAVAALSRVNVQGLIVQGQIGGTDHFDIARQLATEIFSIRCVCGFGAAIPDGVVGLDGLYDAGPVGHLAAIERERTAGPGPGAHLAVITWDITADGFVPVARSHSEMIAGGLAVLLEGLLEQDTVILSTLIPSNFAAMAASLVPWLLVGGTLALHHPFDREAYDEQRKSLRAAVAIIPGPVVTSFAEAGQFATADGVKRVLAIWRGPERLARAPVWRESAMLVDVQVFGEIGLIASRRMHDGNPALIALGPIAAPRVGNGLIVGEVQRTDKGTVTLRGPMVPRRAFPPGAERGHQPALKFAADGFVDTGYACKTDQNGALTVTGAPAGLIDVGGFRFVGPDMHDVVRQGEGGGALAVLPDALMGHRLAGLAADRARLHESLSEFGANPLLTAAFRSHRTAA